MPESQDTARLAVTLDLIDKTLYLRDRASDPAHERLRAALDDTLRRLAHDLMAPTPETESPPTVPHAPPFAKGDRVRVVGPPSMSATTGAHRIGREGRVLYIEGKRRQIAFATDATTKTNMVYEYEWYDASSLERVDP